jgi:hypothetical protein
LFWRLFYLHDGAACPHFRHYTTTTPKVNRGTIIPVSQKQLWGAVPQSHNTVCVSENKIAFISSLKFSKHQLVNNKQLFCAPHNILSADNSTAKKLQLQTDIFSYLNQSVAIVSKVAQTC